MGLFLTCIVLTTLIGLFAGLLISNFTHDSYLTADRGSQEQQTVQSQPESSDGTAQTPSGSSDAQGVLTTTPVLKNDSQYTKAEIIEKCAPSVVGIDITYTANSSYYFGYGFGGTQEAQARRKKPLH